MGESAGIGQAQSSLDQVAVCLSKYHICSVWQCGSWYGGAHMQFCISQAAQQPISQSFDFKGDNWWPAVECMDDRPLMGS